MPVHIFRQYTSYTTHATLSLAQRTVGVYASSATITLNLPSAASVPYLEYNIKKLDSATNHVIIDPFASETIDGATTKSLTAQWASTVIISDGTNWLTF